MYNGIQLGFCSGCTEAKRGQNVCVSTQQSALTKWHTGEQPRGQLDVCSAAWPAYSVARAACPEACVAGGPGHTSLSPGSAGVLTGPRWGPSQAPGANRVIHLVSSHRIRIFGRKCSALHLVLRRVSQRLG